MQEDKLVEAKINFNDASDKPTVEALLSGYTSSEVQIAADEDGFVAKAMIPENKSNEAYVEILEHNAGVGNNQNRVFEFSTMHLA